MKHKFLLTIDAFETVNEIPSTWLQEDCLGLLKHLEFSDAEKVESEQLRDYAVMALQDLEIDEAAHALLDYTFGDKLPSGKKQNIAEDIQKEPLWEQYSDLAYHEPIFNIQRLFNLAFEQTPKPEVNRLRVILSGNDTAADAYLALVLASANPEPFIVRCLASALPDNAILNRLFEDPIKGAPFPDSSHIVWHVQVERPAKSARGSHAHRLTLFCPKRWSNELEDARESFCEPYLDNQATEA